MKSIYRTLLSAAVASLAFACTTEAPLPDLTNAEVSIQGIAEDQEVFGTVKVSAVLGEEVELDQVTFYVDEAEVGVDTLAPFEVEWDSRTVADGSHTFKLVGELQGVSKVVSMPVTVNNQLAVLNVNFDAPIFENRKYYAFLTDAEGKLIGSHVALNQGDSHELRRPAGFEGGTFDLHILEGGRPADGEVANWAEMYTYQDLVPGTFNLASPYYESGESDYTGSAMIHVSNISESEAQNLSFGSGFSWGGYSGVYANGTADYEVEFYEKNSDRLLGKHNTYDETTQELTTTYLLTDEVAVNEEVNLDFNNFVLPELTEVAVPAAQSFDFSVKGLLNGYEGRYSLGYASNWDIEGQATFNLPELPALFDMHRTSIWLGANDNETYSFVNFADGVDATANKLASTVTANYTEEGVELTVEGEHDYYLATTDGFYYDGQTEFYFDWTVVSDRAEQTLKLPEIPAELLAEYETVFTLELEPYGVEAVDYSNWSDKHDMLNATFSNDYGLEPSEVVWFASEAEKAGFRMTWFGIEQEETAARKAGSRRAKERELARHPSLRFNRDRK